MKQPGGDVEVVRFATEIAPKGKGYLAVRRCPPDELAYVLEREAGALFSACLLYTSKSRNERNPYC